VNARLEKLADDPEWIEYERTGKMPQGTTRREDAIRDFEDAERSYIAACEFNAEAECNLELERAKLGERVGSQGVVDLMHERAEETELEMQSKYEKMTMAARSVAEACAAEVKI